MNTVDPERLRRELLLRSLFINMPPAAYARLVERMVEISAPAGETLLAVGEVPTDILFLTEGKVVMEAEGEPPWEFSAVAVVGVIDAVLNRPRKRNCITLEPCKLLRLPVSHWFDLMDDNAQVARSVIRNMALQLHTRWQRVAAHLPLSEPPSGVISGLPDSFDKVLTLRQSPFVKRAGMQALVRLASVAEPLQLAARETLFHTGSGSGELYVVASGSIEMVRAELKGRYGAGELVGGAAALGQALSNYSARALVPSVVLRIGEHDFYDLAEEHERLTRSVLAYLVAELEPMLVAEARHDALSPVPLMAHA